MKENIGIGSRVTHRTHGKGVVINIRSDVYIITFIDSGYKEISITEEVEVLDEMVPDSDMVSFYEVEKTLKKILLRWSDISEVTPLGDKWKNGKLILQPGSSGLASKEIPIDIFFNKIVMVRDRLRVLEQRVNSSNMTNEDKVNIQQYITRVYGSLTTFNILFKYKEDQFVGEKEPPDCFVLKIMRIMAFDYGTKRIGIAVTDPLKIIATSLTTIHSKDVIEYIKNYLLTEQVEGFVVGEPKQMDGTVSQSAPHVKGFITTLKKNFPTIPVEVIDERFTSKIASSAISQGGLRKKRRQNKELIDSISAVIILQSYLEKKNF